MIPPGLKKFGLAYINLTVNEEVKKLTSEINNPVLISIIHSDNYCFIKN